MKGDFSRKTFDVEKHYSRVMMQQGRVTLDADANEQTAILLHYLRTLARDVIGPYGAPVEQGGFELSFTGDRKNLQISAGRYYVDGVLVENDAACMYASQPDYSPADASQDPFLLAMTKPSGQRVVIYLDVWERHITFIDDETIREKALLGPDTCTRAKVMWQVRSAATQDTSCSAALERLSAGRDVAMAAQVNPGAHIKSPCTISPEAKYRGAENHLYRVEVHQGGKVGSDPAPTFKWSRDNGSVATAWIGVEGNDLLVAQPRGFAAGCWVELSNDTLELEGKPGVLVKLAKVEGARLSVDKDTIPFSGLGWSDALEDRHPKVRRWDQVQTEAVVLADGAVPIQESAFSEAEESTEAWIDLEDGIQVMFEANGGEYRTGDYWLIPARVSDDSGNIEWPTGKSKGPDGIIHHYAPLGFVFFGADGPTIERTCRIEFEPLGWLGIGSIAVGVHLLKPSGCECE